MTWLRRVAMVVLCAGCTAGPGAGSSSSGGGPAEPAVVKGYQDFYAALCAYYERCKTTLGPRYSDVTACERVTDQELLVNRRTYEALGLGYDVDDQGLLACTTSLGQAVCADRVPPAVLGCQNALKPKTPRMPGAACSVQEKEGDPRCTLPADNWCNADATGCGVCTVKKDNGQMCSVNDQCKSAFCNTLGGATCADLPSAKGENEGCFFTLECKGNLVCAGPLLQKKCALRSLAGAECDNAQDGAKPRCVEDLACVAGAGVATCALPSSPGQTCTRNANAAVGCADYCVFPSSDSATGTCTQLTALPTDGQPCVMQNVGGYNTPRCATGLALDIFDDVTSSGTPAMPTACTCRARAAAGSICRTDDGCQSFTCNGETMTAAGTCTSLAANGATCTNSRDCQSGYCGGSGASRMCASLPACQ